MNVFVTLGISLLGALLAASVARAQGSEPVASPWASPAGVARTFQQACVLTGGEEAAAVDWALSQGFEPADALRGNLDGLLAGQPGSVLAAPGSHGRVLLAAAKGRNCTVWADQLAGPPLRNAVMDAVQSLSGKAGRVELVVDRHIERAGAWRSQLQWRYRAVGASGEMGLGAITTLSDAPATQALHAAPLPPASAYAPDGIPTR